MKLYALTIFSTSDFGDRDCADTTFYKAEKPEDVVNAIVWDDIFGDVEEARKASWTYESGKACFEISYSGYPGYFVYAGRVEEVLFTAVGNNVFKATPRGDS